MKIFLITFFFIVFSLMGCKSTILKPSQSQISINALSLQSNIIDQQRDTHLSRTEFLLSGELYKPNNKKEPWDFLGFVCSPIGKFEMQHNALQILDNISSGYNAAYAESSKELSVLFTNVFKNQNSFTHLTAEKKTTREELLQKCLTELIIDTDNLNNLADDRVLPIVGGIVAAKAIWDGTKALLIAILQNVDASQREAEFLAFVKNDITNEEMKEALGSCLTTHENKSDNELRECLLEDEISPFSNEIVGKIIQNKRTASLARPFFLWKKYTHPENKNIRANLILNQPVLDDSLSDYDDIRKRRVDPNGHFNLVKGWLEMRRVAKGDLTGKEKTITLYKGMLRFIEGGTAIFNAANGLQGNIKNMREIINSKETN